MDIKEAKEQLINLKNYFFNNKIQIDEENAEEKDIQAISALLAELDNKDKEIEKLKSTIEKRTKAFVKLHYKNHKCLKKIQDNSCLIEELKESNENLKSDYKVANYERNESNRLREQYNIEASNKGNELVFKNKVIELMAKELDKTDYFVYQNINIIKYFENEVIKDK